MPKEFYDISYKTYFNKQLKQVVFQGEKTYPLYVRVTFDRRSVFFKSYYFSLFSQPRYDFLKVSLTQIDELERRAIDYIIAWMAERFDLEVFLHQYKLLSSDVLDTSEGDFRFWLWRFFEAEGLPGLAKSTQQLFEGTPIIRLWDDLKRVLDPVFFARMEEKAIKEGPPYIVLASYVRRKFPKGPFCLPLHMWIKEKDDRGIRSFMDSKFRGVDFDRVREEVRTTMLIDAIIR